MSKEMILMLHPTFGVLGLIASVWVFVEAVNAGPANVARIRSAGVLTAILIWLAYIVGGYFYVLFYSADKALILSGPWTYAHSFFMETKEHASFMLLLLATFLAIAVQADVGKSKAVRQLVLYVSGLVVLMVFAMEGAGAVISMGVKVALLAKQVS
jgi:hypothetical protein